MTAQRLDRLRALLDEHELDALYVSDPYNRRYLSGFTGTNGWLLITRDEAVIATDFRYWEQTALECPGFKLFKTIGPATNWLGDLLSAVEAERIGFEAASLTYADYRTAVEMIEKLPEGRRPRFVPAPSLVEKLREKKDAEEVAKLEAAVALGDAAIAHAVSVLRPGMTELQVSRVIYDYIRDHGGESTSFETIVACGARGAMPHARAGDNVIEEGQPIVIDMGALLDGYCSDLTRTIMLGEQSRQFNAVYDIVLTAQLTAEELIEPGMTGEQAHKLAFTIIEQAGHGEHFGHGLGHGIGLQIHEAPRLALLSTSKIEEGQVFSVEPGIYLSGWGGVRIEDLVVMEHGKCRVLSRAPKIRPAGVSG